MVTLEVPDSHEALLETVARFPAFAIAFAAVISLWFNHRQFFATYPLGHTWTAVLNSALLLIVLLYVYPLKLLAEVIGESFLGAAPNVTVEMGAEEFQGLFLIFGAAVAATLILLAALHARAWRLRHALGLSELGRFDLRQEIVVYTVLSLIALLSMFTAAIGLGLSWGLPGWLYVLAPLAVAGHQLLTAGARHRIQSTGHVQ